MLYLPRSLDFYLYVCTINDVCIFFLNKYLGICEYNNVCDLCVNVIYYGTLQN